MFKKTKGFISSLITIILLVAIFPTLFIITFIDFPLYFSSFPLIVPILGFLLAAETGLFLIAIFHLVKNLSLSFKSLSRKTKVA
ncbi:hypothetical protein M1615_04285 [Patescibacteria group bacterium]|nr:hypothetical protein [Patescibacteria group bacterium]MCL5010015.1 hypothetical protein [Patescibacteria group bacterium]